MINYHTDITTLSIFAFDQISKTGDVSLLLHEGEKEFPSEVAYKTWNKDGTSSEWMKYGGGELNPEYVLHDVLEQDDEGREIRAKFSVDSIKIWSDVYNSQIKYAGTPQDIERARRLRAKASRLYEDAYCKGQKHKLTFAKLADKQADDIFQKLESNDYSLEKTCVSLSKYMGFDIDSRTTTVEKFNSYIELAKKETE
jgi:hypothetical protein